MMALTCPGPPPHVTAVTLTRPQDWTYLAEGSSTVVFAYTGFLPRFTGKVLRLRKTDTSEDHPVVAFQNTVIAPLVPSQFLPDLETVLLDAAWLEALQRRDHPTGREVQIDTTRHTGVLATNLVGGTDVLAVEIKPKWGFLPNPTHLSRETAQIKTSTCRFCMHARFKCQDGRVLTQYCPLDLYSDDEERVKKAIRDLWDGWVQSEGALNNLRLFIAGKAIPPSERAVLGKFLSAETEMYEALTSALLPLLRSPVLRTLSSLQRSLDALDIEGILKLHAMTYPAAGDLGTARKNPSLQELQHFSASYHAVYCSLDHSELCPGRMDTYLIAYLLSAIFKDCSVIFRIRRTDLSENPSFEDDPRAISLVDLDFKGMDRFERWASLDKRIVEHYRDVVQRKICVE